MYVFRCPHCNAEQNKSQYLSVVRCQRCHGICKLERYTPELIHKHSLMGNCSSLIRTIDEISQSNTVLDNEEALLLREAQEKLSEFLKAC